MATRSNADPQRIESMSAAARDQFLTKFQGATLRFPTSFHHRPVIRAYKRTFAIAMRNWYLATTLARTALGDAAAAVKLQEAMLAKIAAGLRHFSERMKVFEALAAQDEAFDISKIAHGQSLTDDVVVLGPVAMKFRELFMLCDTYLDHATALYTYGLLPENEFQNAQFDVKKMLRGVDASIRNYRIQTMKRINEAGRGRPGFADATGTDDDGPPPEMADQKPAGDAGPAPEPEQAIAAAA